MKLIPCYQKNKLILANTETQRFYSLNAPHSFIRDSLIVCQNNFLHLILLEKFSINSCKIKHKFEKSVRKIFATDNETMTVFFEDNTVKMYTYALRSSYDKNNIKITEKTLKKLKIDEIFEFENFLEKNENFENSEKNKTIELKEIYSYTLNSFPQEIYSDFNLLISHFKQNIQIFPLKIKYDIPENTMSFYDRENSILYFFDFVNLYAMINNSLELCITNKEFDAVDSEPVKFLVYANLFIIVMQKFPQSANNTNSININININNLTDDKNKINANKKISSDSFDFESFEENKLNDPISSTEIISSTELESETINIKKYKIEIYDINTKILLKEFENLNSAIFSVKNEIFYFLNAENFFEEFLLPKREILKIKAAEKLKQDTTFLTKEEKEQKVFVFNQNKSTNTSTDILKPNSKKENILKKEKKIKNNLKKENLNSKLNNLFSEESEEIKTGKRIKNIENKKKIKKQKKVEKFENFVEVENTKILSFKNSENFIQSSRQENTNLIFVKTEFNQFYLKLDDCKILDCKNEENKIFVLAKNPETQKTIFYFYSSENLILKKTLKKKYKNICVFFGKILVYNKKFCEIFEIINFYNNINNNKEKNINAKIGDSKSFKINKKILKACLTKNFVYFLSRNSKTFSVFNLGGEFVTEFYFNLQKGKIEYFDCINYLTDKNNQNYTENSNKNCWFSEDLIVFKLNNSHEIFSLNNLVLFEENSKEKILDEFVNKKVKKISSLPNKIYKLFSVNFNSNNLSSNNLSSNNLSSNKEESGNIFYFDPKKLKADLSVGMNWKKFNLFNKIEEKKTETTLKTKNNLKKRFNPFKI